MCRWGGDRLGRRLLGRLGRGLAGGWLARRHRSALGGPGLASRGGRPAIGLGIGGRCLRNADPQAGLQPPGARPRATCSGVRSGSRCIVGGRPCRLGRPAPLPLPTSGRRWLGRGARAIRLAGTRPRRAARRGIPARRPAWLGRGGRWCPGPGGGGRRRRPRPRPPCRRRCQAEQAVRRGTTGAARRGPGSLWWPSRGAGGRGAGSPACPTGGPPLLTGPRPAPRGTATWRAMRGAREGRGAPGSAAA
jgi:hypothetical protein